MNVIIRAKAADDLTNIHTWIARDNPQAAAATIRRIRRHIGRLGFPGLAHMGRPGRVEGTRELIDAPYIIVYQVNEDRQELVVLAVFHGAQSR
jgi:toxin ParE1/3/4